MIDDLNLDFEDHDRGRGRRRRAERADERAADRGQGSWDGRQQHGREAQPDPREQTWGGRGGQPPERYDTGGQPRFDTGGQQRHADPRYDERYDTGRPDPGGQPRYDTGGQPRYDTGGQPRYADPRQERQYDPRYEQGGPRYDTGGQPRFDTGGQQRYAEPRQERQFDPRYDTGSRRYEQLADDRYDPRYDTQGGGGGAGGGGGFFDDGFGGGGGGSTGGAGGGGEDGGRRRVKKSKKKRRGRSYLALFLTLVLLGGLGGAAYFGYNKISNYFLTPDYDGSGTGTVQIEVKQGQLLAEIGNTLVKADVVKSAKAFVSAAEANKDSTKIQPGFYTMHKQMSGNAAVLAMLDPKNRLTNAVTIPEGLIAIQIYSLLSEKLKIPLADFQKAADPVKLGIPDWWYKRTDGKKVAGGVEGFLFPDTYAFPPNVTAESALKTMVDRFLTVTGNLNFADTVQGLHISPYEALVAASIGQAEVVKAEDYPKVARVLYNRVYKDGFPCKCLQIDSAVNYWLRVTGKVPKDSSQILRGEQHNPKDPYNTFDAPAGSGMPIGPISNPGEAALKGAMSPAAGPWTYFMTIDKAGTMGYATDWAGHCANYAKAVKNGILNGTCNG